MSLSVFPSDQEFEQAINALKQGGIVAFPTETFYGLAVDPENDQAIASLFALKKRATGKPLSLLVPDLEILSSSVHSIPLPYKKLFSVFWPGPLTLVFPAPTNSSPLLTGDDNTLAIRISSNPVAQHLCRLWGRSFTATSANISGKPALVTAAEVHDLWGDEIACVLDGGETPGGKGSTIVRCVEREYTCHILRDGVISASLISQALPLNYIVCKS